MPLEFTLKESRDNWFSPSGNG